MANEHEKNLHEQMQIKIYKDAVSHLYWQTFKNLTPRIGENVEQKGTVTHCCSATVNENHHLRKLSVTLQLMHMPKYSASTENAIQPL